VAGSLIDRMLIVEEEKAAMTASLNLSMGAFIIAMLFTLWFLSFQATSLWLAFRKADR
jgi:hypothetical protein